MTDETTSTQEAPALETQAEIDAKAAEDAQAKAKAEADAKAKADAAEIDAKNKLVIDAAEKEAGSIANCSGELKLLPEQPAGVTFHSYECKDCHQIVNVGDEDLALNGLPKEHSPVIL